MALYSIKDLEYNIIVEVKNPNTQTIHSFKRDMLKPGVEVKDTKVFLDRVEVIEYVKRDVEIFASINQLDFDDIEVYSYKIEHKYKDVDIFFEANMSSKFDIFPSVYVIYNPIHIDPILTGEQVNDNTILWKWECEGEFFSEVFDFHFDSIKAQLPLNVNYFTESGFKEGDVISRYVTVTSNGITKRSNPVSIQILKIEEQNNLVPFEKERRNEDIAPINTKKMSRLKAFKSGVGDFNDLLIGYPKSTGYSRDFSVLSKVYALKNERLEHFKAVQFRYRYKAEGSINYLGYGGEAHVTLTVYDCVNIKDDPSARGVKLHTSDTQVFTFRDDSFVSELYVRDFVEHFINKDKLINYYNERYEFEFKIETKNSSVKCYSQVLGMAEVVDSSQTFTTTFKGFRDALIRLVSVEKTQSRNYVEYFPPLNQEPLYASVNGDYYKSENGYSPLERTMHNFDIPSEIYNIEYSVEIDKDYTTDNAFVVYKLEKGIDQNKLITKTNGDKVTFTHEHYILDTYNESKFITQKESGMYSVSTDQIVTVKDTVSINDVSRDLYNGAYAEILLSRHDIKVLEDRSRVVGTSFNIDVDILAVDNDMDKWNPTIHSGYYYLNNEERYMYSDCVKDDEHITTKTTHFTETVKVDLIIDYISKRNENRHLIKSFTSYDDLITNNELFNVSYTNVSSTGVLYKNILHPRPLVDDSGYFVPKDKYKYELSGFSFTSKPTDFLGVSWSEYTNCGAKVKCFIESYDEVRGEYRPPVEVFNNSPSANLVLSQVNRIYFEMDYVKSTSTQESVVELTSEADFIDYMDDTWSSNVHMHEDRLRATSKFVPMVYTSKVIDTGTVGGIQVDLFNFDSNMVLQVVDSDAKSDMEYKDFRQIPNDTFVSTKRYVRFKVTISNDRVCPHIKFITKGYKYAMSGDQINYRSHSVGISDIVVKYYNEGIIERDRVELSIAKEVLFDGSPKKIVDDLGNYVDFVGEDLGYTYQDIYDIEMIKSSSNKGDFTIYHELFAKDRFVSNTPLYVIPIEEKVKEEIDTYEVEGKFHELINNVIELDIIPKSFAPIIIYMEDLSTVSQVPLRRVYFTNERDNKYSLEHTERIDTHNYHTYYLQNFDIDPSSVRIFLNGWLYFNYKIEDNVLIVDEAIGHGKVLTIHYKVFDTFCVNYDLDKEKALITVHKRETTGGRYRIHYEQKDDSFEKVIDSVSLNPIYNPMHSGFIYLSDKIQEPFKIEIIVVDDFVIANPSTRVEVLVFIKDELGNPIPGVYVNSVVALGSLDMKLNITDENGIAKYIYTPFSSDATDVFKCAVTEHLGAETKIINVKI